MSAPVAGAGPRVLLLGGTAEARELAAALVAAGVDVTSSLAGRVARPRLPVGAVRIGGFGGVAGLRSALGQYDVVVDATHPFARGISAHAVAACAAEGVPLLRLERPGWPLDPSWHCVDTHDEAAALTTTLTAARTGSLGEGVLLTVGRQELARFAPALTGHRVLARVVDAPEITLPAPWRLLLSRGPYTLAGERALMAEHGTAVLVTKDSGGTYTWPKLQAAAELGVAVVVVRRPQRDPRTASVDAVAPALAWALAQR